MNTEKRLNLFILLPVALVAFAILCALGVWQLQRLTGKQDLIAQINARVTQVPISLADAARKARETGDVDYLVVTAIGHFLPEQERHFYSIHNGVAGWEIFAPFKTNGRTLLVNRGFVPVNLKQNQTRADDQAYLARQTDIEITGLLRTSGVQEPFVPDNDEAANIWYWRDLEGMLSSFGILPSDTLPFYLDLVSPAPPGGLPTPGITRLDIPNNHLGYAITWFGLAGALVVIVGLFIRRRNHGNSRHAS